MTDVTPLAKELTEYTVTPGVLGFIVFAVLGVGVWVLLRSMSRHLGRIDFEEGAGKRRDGGEPAAEESSTDRSAATSS
ncbi:hypothetical protein FH609_016655 [Streptomyces sp. 3MP-14]|uniref:Uncharacterized protein n=1 Tax=Streptomyces mimosae TaxID=2586635 RepID=A0A5N6AB06_9ACTN|nr:MULTISPECIES: hypothetical protein [Streptomyces]KAB8165213.1 hypothetical protein FH607_013980 [Streptomyces mimosae]KAB8175845.1 hypothetical protein FH609_016655 [Streptomyces sp. 3MP-14]